MMRLSTGRMAGLSCIAVTGLPLFCVIILLTGCTKQTTPSKPAAAGDPLAELPVVLSRQALVIQDQTRGIGTLFNDGSFQERKREAERVEAEHRTQIEELNTEIEERWAYIKAVESLKNNIESDSSVLPPYFELVSQVPRTNPSNEDLWKLAGVWVELERKAAQYRQYVDDLCAGQMARKYLSLSDDIQKGAEGKIQSVLSGMHSRFADISENYGKESNLSRLEQHLETLDKLSQTLTSIGSDYYDMQHNLYSTGGADRPQGAGRADKALFSTTFDEVLVDIQANADKIRSHIAVCKVYNSCFKKLDQLIDNGLQANDIPVIDGLKDQLTDMKLQAPNKDSENLLVGGREDMDRRVEREADRMRRTLQQLDELCKGRPNFGDPEGYLGRLRKGQEELRAIKSVFYALNLFDEAQKAEDVRGHAARLEKAFEKLRDMNGAYQEMQGYARELRQMPAHGMRTSTQRKRADEIRDTLRDYRVRFSKWRSDLELQEEADRCLTVIDDLLEVLGG